MHVVRTVVFLVVFCFSIFFGVVYIGSSPILFNVIKKYDQLHLAIHHGANWKPVNQPTPQPTLSWIEARSVHLTFAKRLFFFGRGWLPTGDLRGVEDLGVYYISRSIYAFCLSVLSVSKCTYIYVLKFSIKHIHMCICIYNKHSLEAKNFTVHVSCNSLKKSAPWSSLSFTTTGHWFTDRSSDGWCWPRKWLSQSWTSEG